MSDPWRARLHDLSDAAVEAELETGRREETMAEVRDSLLRRACRIGGGSCLVGIGAVFLLLPGPGLLMIFGGLVLLSRDVPFAARMVHQVRRRLPLDERGQLPAVVIARMVAMGLLVAGVGVWWFTLR